LAGARTEPPVSLPVWGVAQSWLTPPDAEPDDSEPPEIRLEPHCRRAKGCALLPFMEKKTNSSVATLPMKRACVQQLLYGRCCFGFDA
jgi:hypothetical protein